MEDLTELVSVPAIVMLVYGAMALYKYIVNGKENLIRLIPVFAVLSGVILGVIAYYSIPDIMPAANVYTAILVGGASGLAATGSNQIIKQLTKCECKTENVSDNKVDNAKTDKADSDSGKKPAD